MNIHLWVWLALAATLLGCGPVETTVTRIQSSSVFDELTPRTRAIVEEAFTRRDLVTMEWIKLNDPKLGAYIEHQVEMLKEIDWPAAYERLRELGLEAIPYLIDALDATESTAAEFRPRHGPSQYVEQPTGTHGELAWYVLTDIIIHASNWKPPPSAMLPARDKAVWKKWYEEHGKSLIVYGRKESLVARGKQTSK